MKSFLLASLLVVAVSSSLLAEHGVKFQAFKLKHSKTYKNPAEETIRFSIFRDNLRSIEEHNALYEQGLVSYKQGINKFSDMTSEEFRALLATHQKPNLNATKYIRTNIAVPQSVDWRSQGQVTPAKNQGQCGSCWAFCITGSTEAAYFRKHGKLVSLSEQQLVDCSTDINDGCNGGYLEQTFPYIEKYGLESEGSYQYQGYDGYCRYDASKVVTKVDRFVTIYDDEDALLEAVGTIGPVSVAMDASYLSQYESGVYNDDWCSPQVLNHGVLIVGYGTESGQKYWIVKNSWGQDWGEQGFFKILRGVNECGIAEDTVYPVIN